MLIRKTVLTLRAVAGLTCVLAILAGTTVTAFEEEGNVRGTIEAVEQDDDGNVTVVSLYDNEWGPVLISSEGKGEELLDHVGAVATLTGTIVETGDHDRFPYVITVSDYVIEEHFEPEDEPDDEPDPDPDPDQ